MLLCQTANQVLALEVDPRMVKFLKTELAGYPNLEVQEQDALGYPFKDLPDDTIIVANLPYNISTPIMFRLLEAQQKISRMVLTIQFEVAQRLSGQAEYQRLWGAFRDGAAFGRGDLRF